MAKAIKRRPRQQTPKTTIPTVVEAQGDVVRNALLLQDMYQSEVRALTAERELAEIRRKLVSRCGPHRRKVSGAPR